jgi:hypothetical protein
MISYLLARLGATVGLLSYVFILDEREESSNWFPIIEDSDFIDLDPFKNW